MLRDKIESLASDFADAVLAAIRECSLEELMGGRASDTASEPVARAPRAKSAKSSGRLARRSQDDIDKAADDIVAFVKGKKEGVRAEEIRKSLGIDKREWMRPLQAALDSKRLKKSGEKRATVYTAGGSTSATKPKAKKAKAKTKKAAPKAKAKAKPAKKSAKKAVPKAAKSNGAATAEHAASAE